MRAWVARPDALRVERLEGALLVADNEPPRPGSRALLTTGGGQVLPDPPPAAETAPVYDEDGLVAERPREVRYDDPMFQSYHWVAMLDPVEQADGVEHQSPPGARVGPPVLFEEIVEVDHGGRVAWEARCRPSATYWPRCSCCALLLAKQAWRGRPWRLQGLTDISSSWRPQRIARISPGRRRSGGFVCGRRWALTSQYGTLLFATGRVRALSKLRTRVRFPSLALEHRWSEPVFLLLP